MRGLQSVCGRVVALGASVLLGSCEALSPPASEDAGPPSRDGGPRPPYVAEHTFPAVALQPGEEVLGVCQSWTLHNPEDLWVNGVTMRAGPGWHHSNWMFVPETAFEGPDGTWDCAERRFSEIAASAAGGGVFFAQSTQSTEEAQRFPAGAAYRIPAFSRIIGSIHVLNASPEPISSALSFRIETIEASAVTVRLRGLAIDNRAIEIGPRSTTQATTACDLRPAYRNLELDFSVYYVLPHYHAFAEGMRVTIFGGPRDGELVFETTGGIGNVLGDLIDPPISLVGAHGLRVTCTYRNETAATVRYGSNAEDEMCTILAYTDADRQFGGIANSIARHTTLPDGTVVQEGDCAAVSIAGP